MAPSYIYIYVHGGNKTRANEISENNGKTLTGSDTPRLAVPFQPATPFYGLLSIHYVTQFLQKDEILPHDAILLLAFQLHSFRVENHVRPAFRRVHVDRASRFPHLKNFRLFLSRFQQMYIGRRTNFVYV